MNLLSGILRITSQNDKRIAIYTTKSLKLNKEALHYIVNDYPYIQEPVKAGENTYLSYYSKYMQNNQLIYCHCNYRSEGPWYDWVMIRWEPNYKQNKQRKIGRMSCST